MPSPAASQQYTRPALKRSATQWAIAAQRASRAADYDPDRGVLVTIGATEAIAAAVLGLASNPEVLRIELASCDSRRWCDAAGAHRVTVLLVPMASRFLATDAPGAPRDSGADTINSPHNPTGAVLSATELAAFAEIAGGGEPAASPTRQHEHLRV